MTDANTKILVPITIPGKLIGYDADKLAAIREPDIIVTFDLTNASAHFGRFINSMGKDKIAPAYNLLAALVVAEDKEAMVERLANPNDGPAIMTAVGELSEIIIPAVEKTTKNSLALSSLSTPTS